MWTKETSYKLPFGIPILQREPRDPSSDCYFYIVKTSGIYSSLPYVQFQSAEISVPIFVDLPSCKKTGLW